MKRFHLALLSVLLLSTTLVGVAFAHAKFVKSEPAPDSMLTVAPQQVTIWFTEELDTKSSTIKVFDAANAQVDAGNSKVNLDDRKQMSVGLKPLANGIYTVKWHSVSDDDKGETDGDFKFTVRATGATVPAYPQPTTVASPTPRATVAPTAVASPTVAPSATVVSPPTAALSPTTARASPTPVQPLATSALTSPTSNADFTLLLIMLSVVVLGVGTVLVLRKK